MLSLSQCHGTHGMASQGAECRALDLPFEAWYHITEALEAHEKASLAATCRTLRAASADWFRNDAIPLRRATIQAPEIAWLCRMHAAVELSLNPTDWPIIDTLGAAGVRLAGLSLAGTRCSQPLPAELAALTQVSRLSLANSRFAGGLDRLPQQLQQLDLSACCLLHVPDEMAVLTQLTSLSLAANFVEWSGGWQHLPAQLRQLDLSKCSLQQPPPEVMRLPHLADLRLDNNPIESWQHLGWAEHLRCLHMQNGRLRQVPEQMARLTQLASLSLASNPIKGGWQHLPAQLRRLDLEWCGLWRVPAELEALMQLSKLSLDHNPLIGDWQHLPVQLQHLALRGRAPQLTAVLGAVPTLVLSPMIWGPVTEFVCSIENDTWMACLLLVPSALFWIWVITFFFF